MDVYLLFCGGPTQKRAERLIKEWEEEGKKGVFLLTGYPKEDPSEVKTMIEFLISNGVPKDAIIMDSSYKNSSGMGGLEKVRVFFLFGGCPTQKRAERLIKEWEKGGKKGIFLITGYPKKDPGEVETMIEFLISNGVPKDAIIIDSSYETFSNVESLEKFLIKYELEENQCKIYGSTGLLHWIRFLLIFLWEFLFGENDFNFFKIKYLFSKEWEVVYALPSILCYVVFTPKGFQKITQRIRNREYKLCLDRSIILNIAEKYGVTALGFCIYRIRSKLAKLVGLLFIQIFLL